MQKGYDLHGDGKKNPNYNGFIFLVLLMIAVCQKIYK